MTVERVQANRVSQVEVSVSPGDAFILATLEESSVLFSSWAGRPEPAVSSFLLPYRNGGPILEVDLASASIRQVDLSVGTDGKVVTTPRQKGYEFWNRYFLTAPRTAGNFLSLIQTAVEATHWHLASESKQKRAGRAIVPQ